MITTINEFKKINEAVDLRCPNCGDNLGKDTENPKLAYCGNCGEDNIKNPRGYNESKINESRDLEAYALSIGVINIPTGKTMYDWSIYDQEGAYVYYTGSNLLYAVEGTFEIGDRIVLRNNDNLRKINTYTIQDACKSVKEEVISMLLKHGYDYRPARAFKKKQFDRKLMTSFSIKGVKSLNEGLRRATTLEKLVFEYLNELRESGATNMYGAVPYIIDEFNEQYPSIDQKEAKRLLSLWMKNFNQEGNYNQINENADYKINEISDNWDDFYNNSIGSAKNRIFTNLKKIKNIVNNLEQDLINTKHFTTDILNIDDKLEELIKSYRKFN